MTDRIQRLNIFVISIVVGYAIFFERILSSIPNFSPIVSAIITFLTSVAFYDLLLRLIYFLVENLEFFLRLYWGRLYINGLWSYSYTLDGQSDDTVYIGVWRFEQNLYETKVVGFGLTDRFIARSRVRSVTDMLYHSGAYEVVNIRSDSIDSSNEYYSETTMYFELNKNLLFKYPSRMRGKTIMYGGPLTGRVCNNVFIRHETAKTEEDVIDELRKKYSSGSEEHKLDGNQARVETEKM